MAELLPWLLNGSLEEEERVELRAHLAACSRCRQQLEESAAVWVMHAAHPPTSLLVDWAEGRPLAASERRLVAEHLESCESCRRQAELAAEVLAVDLDDGNEGEATPRATRRASWRQVVLAAAALLVAVLAGSLLWQQRAVTRRAVELDEANTALRQELETERRRGEARGEEVRGLEDRLAILEAPRVGLAWTELRPTPDRMRGGDAPPERVEVDAAARGLVLVLARENQTRYDRLRLKVMGPGGETLWQADDLPQSSTKEVVLELAAPLLADGILTLRLEGEREDRWRPVETYRLRIVQDVPRSGR